jgi:hypothetical protein
MRCRIVVLSGVLLAACGGGAAPTASGPCGPCQAAASAGLQDVGPQSPKLKALGLKRVDLARKRLVLLRTAFDLGKVTIDEVFAACRDVAFAARDSGLHGGALRDVLREYRDAVVALKNLTRERAAKGAVGEEGVARVDALLAEAEFWLEEGSQGL